MKATITLIDDEVNIRELIKEFLDSKYNIIEFDNPLDFIESIEKKYYCSDILITDYSMPNMSGLRLCKFLEAIQYSCPVIMITGAEITNESDLINLVKIIKKPFRANELLTEIERIMHGKRKEEGNNDGQFY